MSADPPVTPVPDALLHAANDQVLASLAGLSAHSDVVEILQRSLAGVDGVEFYCPGWDQYRYVVAHREGVVFAFAIGMRVIGIRLDDPGLAAARADGAESFDNLDAAWVQFRLFESSGVDPDITTHLRRAAEAVSG